MQYFSQQPKHLSDRSATQRPTKFTIKNKKKTKTSKSSFIHPEQAIGLADSLQVSTYPSKRSHVNELFVIRVNGMPYVVCGQMGDVDDAEVPTYYSMVPNRIYIYPQHQQHIATTSASSISPSSDTSTLFAAVESCTVEWSARHADWWTSDMTRDTALKRVQSFVSPSITKDQASFILKCIESPYFCKKFAQRKQRRQLRSAETGVSM